MRKGKDFFDRFGERLDIPRAALPGGFSLSLSGQGELLVEGCRRISEYGDTKIRLLLSNTELEIKGEALLCTSFVGERLVICGRICSLAFEEVRCED